MHTLPRLILQFSAAGMLAALVVGCATVPAPLAGDYPQFQPEQATDRSVGARVRWGGTIVDTRPGAEETCIEILARELDRDYRPLAGDGGHGRFLACRDGFKDPAVFTNGRDITVTGRLTGFTSGQIGEFEYTYPKVDADVLYLWSTVPDRVYYADPWWYYDPWWPYYRHPYRYGRTRLSGHMVIIR